MPQVSQPARGRVPGALAGVTQQVGAFNQRVGCDVQRRGVGQAFGGLVGGKLPGPEAIMPDAQLLVIVPDAGDKADVFYGTLRLLMKKADAKVEPFEANGRKGFRVADMPESGPITPSVAWWVEGKHFVFYFGTRKPAVVVAEMSGHSIYLGFLKELIARSSLIILLYRRHDTPACGTDHHAGIVSAIRERDKKAARAQMLSHLREIEAELFLKDPAADELRLADVLGA